jgi:uncharacterized spore protein YtfJ
MTDQEQEPLEEDLELLAFDPTIDFMQDTMDAFLAAASVDAVYGEPIQTGDTLIIPAAEVVAGMAFGIGSGSGPKAEDSESGGGSGGGGGGRVFSRPVAMIVASPEGVRVEPIMDTTKIALAALTAGAFMLGMLVRLFNPKKALEDLQDGDWG